MDGTGSKSKEGLVTNEPGCSRESQGFFTVFRVPKPDHAIEGACREPMMLFIQRQGIHRLTGFAESSDQFGIFCSRMPARQTIRRATADGVAGDDNC